MEKFRRLAPSPRSSTEAEVGDVVVREGQLITIDGVTGQVMLGEVPTVPPQLSGASGSKSPKKIKETVQPRIAPHPSICSRISTGFLEPRQKKGHSGVWWYRDTL